jgi:hypothetical protein
VLSVAGGADAIHIAAYYWEYPHWAQERMPSSANSSYLPSVHQLSSTTTRPPFWTVFVGARNLHEIAFSSPTPDKPKTLIDSRFPRLTGDIAQAPIRLSDAVCGPGSATTWAYGSCKKITRVQRAPTTSWMSTTKDDVLPGSLLNLSEPSSSGGDLFPCRTGTYPSLLHASLVLSVIARSRS